MNSLREGYYCYQKKKKERDIIIHCHTGMQFMDYNIQSIKSPKEQKNKIHGIYCFSRSMRRFTLCRGEREREKQLVRNMNWTKYPVTLHIYWWIKQYCGIKMQITNFSPPWIKIVFSNCSIKSTTAKFFQLQGKKRQGGKRLY